jgi:hypothetical protein
MESISVDKRDCPQIFKAVYILYVNPALKMDSAMKIEKFLVVRLVNKALEKQYLKT